MVLLIAVPAVTYLLIRQHNVQTMLVKRVLRDLSEQTGTEITVGKVHFSLFHDLSLEEVFVADQRKDTLLYAHSLRANFDTLNVFDKKIYVSKLTLEDVVCKVRQYPDSSFNFTFLIDSLSPKDTLPREKWKLDLKKVDLSGGDLAYYGKQSYHIEHTQLKGDLLSLKKDSLNLKVKDVAFKDTAGIVLNDFSTTFLLTHDRISVSDFSIETDRSDAIIPFAEMSKHDILHRIISDTTKVGLNVDEMRLSTDDIRRFFPNFIHVSEKLFFSGKIDGTIGDLKGDDLLLSAGDAFDLLFSMNISGLPDFNNSFIFADFSRMFISPDNVIPEIEKLTGKSLPLKKEIRKFGRLLYTGTLTGFPGDFVAYGELNSELGSINADIALKDNATLQKVEIAGNVNTEGFNLGEFVDREDEVGYVSMNVDMEADKPYNENMSMFMNGEVSSLEFHGYTYSNIFLRGVLGSKHFNGGVNMNDPNLSLLFTGRVDFSDVLPIFDFDADIRKISPYNLKLSEKFENGLLSTQLKTKLKGNNLENLEGYIGLYDLLYTNDNGEINSENATVFFNREDTFSAIQINSDWINGQLKGTYEFSKLKQSVADIIRPFLPTLSSKIGFEEMVGENQFDFSFDISSLDNIRNVLELPFTISSPGNISGRLDDGYELMDLNIELDKLSYMKFVFDTLRLNLKSADDDRFYGSLTLDKLELNNKFIQNIDYRIFSAGDSIENYLTWNNNSPEVYQGEVYAGIQMKNPDDLLQTTISVRPSYMTISDTTWNIAPTSLVFDTTGIAFSKIYINNNNRYLEADGKLSKLITDTFNLDVDGFELEYLTRFLNVQNLLLQGRITGNSMVVAGLGNPVINSDLDISDFVLNTIHAGDMDVKTEWDETNRKMNIYGKNIISNDQRFDVNGAYVPSMDSLSLTAEMEKLPVRFIQPYLESILQNLQGLGTGEIVLQGNVKDLKLLGDIYVENGSFDVDYLNTRYYLSDTVHMERDVIEFDNVTVYDRDGNSGIFNGTLQHKTFKDMKFDMLLDFNNMLALNTTAKDNDLYYGTVYATGILSIYGEGSKVHMDVNGRTEDYTQIYLPLTSNQVASESNFVRFVSQVQEEKEEEQLTEESGFSFNMEVEATPDARVELIFDSRIGDIIKGQGNGTLVFSYDSKSDFKMYGDYTVSSGEYLFTAQNVINKRFDIEPGGVISWSGDPYDATLNLDAYYRTKAPLYDLLPATVDDVNKTLRVPVNCHMMLTDNLMNPTIKFDVVLPTADQVTQQQIGDVLSSENEVQRQVIYLLMFNRFYTPEWLRNNTQNYANSNQAAVVTGSEFLSNQLSNWLSQISDEFDLGVNYRPADADALTRQEVEVMLSTQMFNDRMTINGNFGYRETNAQSASNFVGDFDVDYRLNPTGNFKLKAYSHTNDNIIYENSPTTQGFGFVYKEEFDSFGELIERYKSLLKKDKEKQDDDGDQEANSEPLKDMHTDEPKPFVKFVKE